MNTVIARAKETKQNRVIELRLMTNRKLTELMKNITLSIQTSIINVG